MRGDAVGVVFAKLLFDVGRLFRLTKTHRVLLDEVFEVDPLNDVERVEGVALALGHLLPFGVAHETVDVDVLEGNASREVARHHHHAGDPEEDDVVARHEHGARQVQVVHVLFDAFGIGPAKGREGNHGGGIPGVEHVFVARKLHAGTRLLLGFGFVMRHVDIACFVVPGRNLMAPPELTRNAPVLNVFKPLAINALPLFREDVDFTRFDGFETHFGDGLARIERAFGRGLAHRHEPLVREHRFDHFAGARDDRHHVLVLLHPDEKTLSL